MGSLIRKTKSFLRSFFLTDKISFGGHTYNQKEGFMSLNIGSNIFPVKIYDSCWRVRRGRIYEISNTKSNEPQHCLEKKNQETFDKKIKSLICSRYYAEAYCYYAEVV